MKISSEWTALWNKNGWMIMWEKGERKGCAESFIFCYYTPVSCVCSAGWILHNSENGYGTVMIFAVIVEAHCYGTSFAGDLE